MREARRVGLPVALACAVLEKETGFRNVFGHDAVRNPIKSPPGGLLAVTEDNYRQYLAHRRRGLGNQGVGPMQLTSPGLQDRADQLGGCWQPGPNIRVGLEFLAGNIRRLGLRAGVVAYNGSGPAAQRYGDDVLAARAALGRSACAARARRTPRRRPPRARPDRPRPRAPAGRPRTFRLQSPLMRGRDIAAFQQLLNERFAGVEHRQAHRRRRRVRADDAPGGAPGRLRPGDLGDRARPRRHARAAHQAAPAQPAHARRGRARRPPPGLARAAAPPARGSAARRRRSPTRASTSGWSRARRRPIAGRSSTAGTARPARSRGARGAATSPTPA